MEAGIFQKLYGSNRRHIPESSQNLYSKDSFLFDYIDKSRPPLTGLDFYIPPEPLNRSPIYSSGSNKQPDYNYPLSGANNFKSASSSSFLDGKSRFDYQETRSLPIFSSNLIRKDMMRPIHYKGKTPLNSRLKDKTEYPMKLPEFEDKQLNESVLIVSDQEETFREPPKIEKEKNGLKNESTFSMTEMEKSSPAQSIEKSKKENEKVLKNFEEKNKKIENENEKKKDKNEKEEKEEKEKKKIYEEKNTNNSKSKEKSRNVIVIIPCICVFVLVFAGICISIPMIITLNNQNNSSIVHTIIITVTKTYLEEYSTTKTTTIAETKREGTTAISEIISNLQVTSETKTEHASIAASEEFTNYSTKTTTYKKNQF